MEITRFLYFGIWNLQYQCHAPKDKKDIAALAFETGITIYMRLTPYGIIKWYLVIVVFIYVFVLVMRVSISFWRLRQVQTICLLYWVFLVNVLLFLSYLSLSSLSHSLEIFEVKLKHVVSRCLGVSTFLFWPFRSLYMH